VGAATWPVGAQVWKGPHAGENCEADERPAGTPTSESDGKGILRQRMQVHGVAAGARRRRAARSAPSRADEGVERQLHRAVLAPRRAPDGDEEVLGDDGDLVEDEEQEEIEAEEDAVDAADEREEEGEELVGALASRCSTRRGCRRQLRAGEQNEHAADAVGRERVVNAHRRNPGHVRDGDCCPDAPHR
jgi:hypothetical protein